MKLLENTEVATFFHFFFNKKEKNGKQLQSVVEILLQTVTLISLLRNDINIQMQTSV